MTSPPVIKRSPPAEAALADPGETMTMQITRLVGLVFSGLFAGFLVAVLVLENSLRSFDGTDYTQIRQAELEDLDRLAAATLIPATIATVILVIFYFQTRSRSRWLALAAVTLMAAVFVVTLTVNLPINGDQLDWSAHAPPADWADVRDRWQIAHAVRTVAAGVAFGLLAMAASARPRVPGQTRRKQAMSIDPQLDNDHSEARTPLTSRRRGSSAVDPGPVRRGPQT